MRTFLNYHQAQRSLVQQVISTIDTKYLTIICNRITGQVTFEIRALILHLFLVYGKFTAQKLHKMYDDKATMDYNLVDPINIIFNAVDDFFETAELLGRPYLPTQVVNLTYMIVSSQLIFRLDNQRWLRKDPVDRTWDIFRLFPHLHIRNFVTPALWLMESDSIAPILLLAKISTSSVLKSQSKIS